MDNEIRDKSSDIIPISTTQYADKDSININITGDDNKVDASKYEDNRLEITGINIEPGGLFSINIISDGKPPLAPDVADAEGINAEIERADIIERLVSRRDKAEQDKRRRLADKEKIRSELWQSIRGEVVTFGSIVSYVDAHHTFDSGDVPLRLKLKACFPD